MNVEINTQHCPAGSPNRNLWFRQTPAGDGVWQDIRYDFAPDALPARWLVAIDQPLEGSFTFVPKERRIFFATEPPEVTHYSASFLNQFAYVVSPMSHPGYRGTHMIGQPGLVWFYGSPVGANAQAGKTLGWQELANNSPQKTANLSVICSTKARTTAQRQRLALVDQLRRDMSDEISFFGRGSNPISDKAEAIAPFRYHIVLENNHIPHFWTEKLADAYLGDSFPLYVGCHNLDAYFPVQSFKYLVADDPEKAVRSIREAVDADLWSKNRASLLEARRRLMQEHNFFALTDRIIRRQDSAATSSNLSRPEELLSSKRFGAAARLGSIARKLFSPGTR